MAKEGPSSTIGSSPWRRCALAALLAVAGCNEEPKEAPFVAARPIPRPALATTCLPCDHTEPAGELAPLPPIDGKEPDDEAFQAKLLPPQALPLDALTEWSDVPSGDSARPTSDHADESVAATPELPPSPADGQRVSVASALPLSSTGGVKLPPLVPLPSTDDAGKPAVRILDILAAMRREATLSSPVDADEELETDELHNADAQQLLAEANDAVNGTPTDAIIGERAQEKIRRGYALAQRGANFAARAEFLEVLRMIAEANDHKHGVRRRTVALANGLRALDEAADFAARGVEAYADANLAVIISSHRTPVARNINCEKALPQQLADSYLRYAEIQLGAAVAGDPAGSMALHALGKLYSQLGRVEPDANPLADRRAFCLQQAALLARDDNHLAAHELGVLLAESGHYVESEFVLAQVAAREPHPIGLRNLARVQRKLGREEAARATEWRAQQLASRNPSASGPVVWVTPDAMARTSNSVGSAAANQTATSSQQSPNPTRQPMSNITRRPGGLLR